MRLFTIVLLISLALTATAFAQKPPAFRVVEAETQMQTFDRLLTQRYISVTDTKAVAPFDVTATNTESVSFLPSDVEYPVKLVIKSNHATNMLVYVPYVTVSGTGITIPTATASRLIDPHGNVVVAGKGAELILYRDPMISIGAIDNAAARATSEVIFEVWGRAETDY